MTQNAPQVPWTDEQWERVRRAVRDEAARARVAANFLPLFGPLAPSADFVTADTLSYGRHDRQPARLHIDDTTTLRLPTLQVKVWLRGAQMADPEMSSALQMFRRAANVLARVEDAMIFNGLPHAGRLPEGCDGSSLQIAEVLGGQHSRGLLRLPKEAPDESDASEPVGWVAGADGRGLGEELVACVSDAIGRLEGAGHFGPFAVALGQDYYTAVQTPQPQSLVLPQDRIVPFLGGGPLVRSSTLPGRSGAVVALGAAPVELVVATDVSLNFLQVTPDPSFVFRVYEKVLLRIKEPDAVVALLPKQP